MKKHNLLNSLRKNSRIRISKLARSYNIPVTTLHFTLKRLEEAIIKKHVALLDFEKQGYRRYFIIITNDSQKIREKILDSSFVNNFYRTQLGVTVEGIFSSNSQYQRFLNYLSDKRIKYRSHPILEVKKQEEMEV